MKKIMFLILLIITPFIVFGLEQGDVDGKNGVDNRDYALVRNHILKTKQLTGNELKRADVDGKNGVDNRDYALIRNIIINDLKYTPTPTAMLTPTPTPVPTVSPTVYVATFYVNGTSKKVSCIESSGKCTITVPNIKIDNYNTLGYSRNKNSKGIEIKVDDSITINSDVTYYGVISRKLTAKFNIQDSNGIETNDKSKSCTIYNDEVGCEIVIPKLTAKSNYTVLGWSTKKDDLNVTVKFNDKVMISDNVNYYSVSRFDTPLVATFNVTDKESSSSSKKCYLYNGNTSCSITTPTVNVSSKNKFAGWAKSKKSTKVVASGNQKISISSNVNYYSVIGKIITITFDVNKNIKNSNISSSNIKADKLSFYSATCESYNDSGCSIKNVPIIYSSANMVKGFSKTKNGSPIKVSDTIFKEDTTLYSRVYNKLTDEVSFDTINIDRSEKYGNVIVEFEKGVSSTFADDYTSFLRQLNSFHPELFLFDGKVMVFTKNTFEYIYKDITVNCKSSSAGCTYGSYYSNILIKASESSKYNYSLGTIVHELGHVADYQSSNYIENKSKVSSTKKIQDLYDYYQALPASERPLRDYSYTNTREFYAEIIRFGYHREKSNEIKPFYILSSTEKPITDDLYSIYLDSLLELKNYYKGIGMIK